jgi:hypothetical protein
MMNKSGCFTLLLATALVLPNGAPAAAQTTKTLEHAAPVHVASCRVASDLLSVDVDHTAEVVAGRLWLILENVQPVPATEVTLQIQYGRIVETLVERGVFSAGSRVKRTSDIIADAPWVGSEPDTCAVVSVKFANGTAWMPASDIPLGSV